MHVAKKSQKFSLCDGATSGFSSTSSVTWTQWGRAGVPPLITLAKEASDCKSSSFITARSFGFLSKHKWWI